MVLSGLQPLHVHGTARPRPGTGAPLRRRALSHELRQPGSSPDTRSRGTEALAASSRRWLRRIAGGRGATGILRAAIGQVGVGAITEWPVEFLRRPRRTPNTIPDFLSPNAHANRLDTLRGLTNQNE